MPDPPRTALEPRPDSISYKLESSLVLSLTLKPRYTFELVLQRVTESSQDMVDMYKHTRVRMVHIHSSNHCTFKTSMLSTSEDDTEICN